MCQPHCQEQQPSRKASSLVILLVTTQLLMKTLLLVTVLLMAEQAHHETIRATTTLPLVLKPLLPTPQVQKTSQLERMLVVSAVQVVQTEQATEQALTTYGLVTKLDSL